MLGLDLVGRAAMKAQHFRSNTTEMWGGLNLCLVGDFNQLPPVQAQHLFATPRGNVKPPLQLGAAFWKQINAVVILTESNRTNDPKLVAVNEALRTGCIPRSVEKLMRKRVHKVHGGECVPRPGATAVCRTHRDVNEFNSMAVHIRGAALKRPVVRLSCVADDAGHMSVSQGSSYFVNCAINEPKKQLSQAKGMADSGILRHVDVFVGMEVMIPTAQVGNTLLNQTGLGNGSRGEVVGFADEDGIPLTPKDKGWTTETVRLPNGTTTNVHKPPRGQVHFLLLKLVDSTVSFRYYGLEAGVLPWRRQTWGVSGVGKFTQFSIRPTFAMTTHKVTPC
jgi:hypothetical protein